MARIFERTEMNKKVSWYTDLLLVAGGLAFAANFIYAFIYAIRVRYRRKRV